MFAIFQLARQWQAIRRRAVMERIMFDLPIELQKDIGWPAIKDQPTAISNQPEQCASSAQ